MAKKRESKGRDVDAQRERLGKGLQLEAGWCFNAERDPDVFRCEDEDEAVARGELSISSDGRRLKNYDSGEFVQREQPERYRAAVPVTLAESTEAGVAATGADTATTDNAPAGTAGAGRTRAR